MPNEFRIMVYDRGWGDSLEGPFDTAKDAITFARNEVGFPWVVVNAQNYPLAFGDATQHFGRRDGAYGDRDYPADFPDLNP